MFMNEFTDAGCKNEHHCHCDADGNDLKYELIRHTDGCYHAINTENEIDQHYLGNNSTKGCFATLLFKGFIRIFTFKLVMYFTCCADKQEQSSSEHDKVFYPDLMVE